jgi:hypothetical protein
MSFPNPSEDPSPQPPGDGSQVLQPQGVGARVPERIGPGIYSNGAVVMHGLHEFVIDFIQGMSPPQRLGVRVVLPPGVVPLLIAALEDNLYKYQQTFGGIPPMPRPLKPEAMQQPIQMPDLYDSLRITDDQLAGAYANTALIVHGPAEFGIDFITGFFPRAAVAARVYLAAPHVPELLRSLQGSWRQFCEKVGAPPPDNPPSFGEPPTGGSPPGGSPPPQPPGFPPTGFHPPFSQP